MILSNLNILLIEISLVIIFVMEIYIYFFNLFFYYFIKKVKNNYFISIRFRQRKFLSLQK